MKTLVLLIVYIILSASFPLRTKAIVLDGNLDGSGAMKNGETCDTSKIQICFDGMLRGMQMSTTCCKNLKEQESCLCDVIKTRMIKSSVLSSRLNSCGITNPKC
ncbi:putative non-specific lipid-transfer protein AKCS9 [Cardamine amara subsp. amara]|uniref:Non-specific lipid-transfer protein AKCS9 n=1 Tax=Cardamine amara subsp. amara TaxID=228776 RepID=A0ABD1BI73_CARAN